MVIGANLPIGAAFVQSAGKFEHRKICADIATVLLFELLGLVQRDRKSVV